MANVGNSFAHGSGDGAVQENRRNRGMFLAALPIGEGTQGGFGTVHMPS